MSQEKGARSRRFEAAMDPIAQDLNASIGFDWRLLEHDIAGSIAHAQMLAAQGIISNADEENIVRGLLEVKADFEAGKLSFDPALEDIHMNIESRLSDRIGDAGRRLHTGRSRNDQVATDLRLFARASAVEIVHWIDQLRMALLDQAEANVDLFMPGYTHLQRAQPVRVAHHLLAYDAMLTRDRGRVFDAGGRAGECPLGAGALAATTFPLDREKVSVSLGFDSVTRNSLDAVGDRDFAVELVAALALCQVHLSRLGEELCLWMSQEFGFVKIGQAYCSGSSMMPQKMNPDIAELLRGKAGRLIGDWVQLMTVIKGLPLAYNKDLQETQEPLYDAVVTVTACLKVATGMVQTLVFDPKTLEKALARGYVLATEIADYLAQKGQPFRKAHDIAGNLVRKAVQQNIELSELSLEDFLAESPLFAQDIYDWLNVARAVDRRNLVGGPAKNQVLAELARIRQELSQNMQGM